jgi:aminopeptidase N
MRRCVLVVGLFFAFVAQAGAASPGAPGVGDRLYPLEGNGGYDVQHYDVDLKYGNAFSDPVDGTVTILARATQSLSRFDLDYSGTSVGAVAVNGAPASFRRDGQELIITPRRAIGNGSLFIVSVRYTAVPTPAGDDFVSTAFFIHDSGTATAPQPDLARYFLPSNDHPSDKASYDIRFDVPARFTAVANGVQLVNYVDRGRRHAVFVQRQPMATELVQLAVGDYDVTNEGFHSGVFLREVTARPLTKPFVPLWTRRRRSWTT